MEYEATPERDSSAERLPSGRHGLTRETVVASQRGRLLDAMAQMVAEQGYAATSVADVVERAGVSRRTFYEQFPDREACFLAAYDTGVELMLGRLRAAVAAVPASDWRARARASIEAAAEVLAAEPEFAWALMVEIIGASPAARDRRAAIMELFADIWRRLHRRGRRQDPSLPALPPEAFRALVGGLDEMVREVMRVDGAQALPRHADRMARVTLMLMGDRG